MGESFLQILIDTPCAGLGEIHINGLFKMNLSNLWPASKLTKQSKGEMYKNVYLRESCEKTKHIVILGRGEKVGAPFLDRVGMLMGVNKNETVRFSCLYLCGQACHTFQSLEEKRNLIP